MLDRLPLQLQQLLLLEWLSPSAVCALARAGSTKLRAAILTSPRAFRAAEGEVLSDACVLWFQKRGAAAPSAGPKKKLLVFSTTVQTWEPTPWSPGFVRHFGHKYRLHRDDDLPAVVWTDGTQEWYQHGRRCRDGDGPTRVDADGNQMWHQKSEFVVASRPWTVKRHIETRWKNCPPDLYFFSLLRDEGIFFQTLEDKLHRDGDLPAVVRADGTQLWYQNGKLHRDGDMPAVVTAGGTREWFQKGQRHRDGDKPAVVLADGTTQAWYERDKLHRGGDRPAIVVVVAVVAGGGQQLMRAWYKNGNQRRGGQQPAIILANGLTPLPR